MILSLFAKQTSNIRQDVTIKPDNIKPINLPKRLAKGLIEIFTELLQVTRSGIIID